ncbi:hypothetical protein HYALB_00010042 [Hymenoscyphus albidus]|uniref:N-acetyltransferase domain-containing protein n=1 Tax=Hymenoscyphus albidus TaxID=595503 RepID=A0A9N9Q4F5_9HELO|nr:hypothetical protein HYALB_00010042 [Hymenoscyphus albidus]
MDLCTAPSHRGLWLASRLIAIGLERADKEGNPCFLSGSPMGVPVYKKKWFEEVGRMSIELGEWGGEGVHVHVAMIRQPRSVEVEMEVEGKK